MLGGIICFRLMFYIFLQQILTPIQLTKALRQVGLLVDENLGGDNCAERLECLVEVGVREFLR